MICCAQRRRGLICPGTKQLCFNCFLPVMLVAQRTLHCAFIAGIPITLQTEQFVCKCFCLFGTFDLPAKGLVLNCHSSNGYFACTVCTHPGEDVTTDRGGHVQAYGMSPRENVSLRSNEEQKTYMKQAVEKKEVIIIVCKTLYRTVWRCRNVQIMKNAFITFSFLWN